MIAELSFGFAAGAVATANPCGFALLPAYVADQLRSARPSGRVDALARALAVGAVTTAGFLLVFGTIGTAMSLGAGWLARAIPWAALVIGGLLILAGLALLLGKGIGLRVPVSLRPSSGGYRGVFLFGLAYGLTSLSCTLPIFLVVVGAAINAGSLTVPLMFAAYALGMGTILSALAVAAALSRAGVASRMRRLVPHMNRLSAVLLVAAGAYVVYYWSFGLFAPGTSGSATSPIEALTRISSAIRAWLGSGAGKLLSVILAVVLAGLGAWVMWRRARERRTGQKAVPESGQVCAEPVTAPPSPAATARPARVEREQGVPTGGSRSGRRGRGTGVA